MENNLVPNSNKDFLNLLISGDHAMCSEFARKFLENHSIQELYEDVFKKALYDIGELWEYNKISVATEHLASAIIESILNEFYSQIILHDKNNKKVVVACVEKEFHEIGIKMISDVFELNGWNSFFLGSNTPLNELLTFIEERRPDVIALSLTLYFNLPILENMIQQIRFKFAELPIIIGGQAFRHGGTDIVLKYEKVIYKSDINSIELLIKRLYQDG